MDGSLGQRLRWCRSEQGITLQQLSERCGRAVSYLCQLELGVKENPTRQTVTALAEALGVRPAFLFGQVPGPRSGNGAGGSSGDVPGPWSGATTPHDLRYADRFGQHIAALPEQSRWDLAYGTSGERVRAVLRFLLSQFPESFTPIELAWQLGMSFGQFRQIMDCGEEASHLFMEQLCRVAGIPLSFLTHGSAEPLTAPTATPAEITSYMKAVLLAQERQISPEQLEALILARRNC